MLNEIKYVYAVYQERSFTKAAKKLFITQPALSSMVKKAEQEIGSPIFDRSTVPLTLTREGKFYIQTIEKIMLLEKNLQDYFQDIQSLNTGSLSVGGSSFFCSFVLPEIIGKFRVQYPNISINLQEGNLKDLREGAEKDRLDLFIETAVRRDDPALKTFFYRSETILLAVPVDYPINQKLKDYQYPREHLDFQDRPSRPAPVPLEAFRNVPFVMLKKEGNDLGVRGAAMCGEAGFSPKVAMFTDQVLTAANIAANGMGAAFLRGDLFRYSPIQDRFCIYALGSKLARRDIFFAAKKGRYINNAMRTFLSMAGARLDGGGNPAAS